MLHKHLIFIWRPERHHPHTRDGRIQLPPLPEELAVMDWRHAAACRDEDPELFFPIGNTGPALSQIEEARTICHRCSVVEDCLTWALESGQDAGVWGGLSEDERRALKRRSRTAVHTS